MAENESATTTAAASAAASSAESAAAAAGAAAANSAVATEAAEQAQAVVASVAASVEETGEHIAEVAATVTETAIETAVQQIQQDLENENTWMQNQIAELRAELQRECLSLKESILANQKMTEEMLSRLLNHPLLKETPAGQTPGQNGGAVPEVPETSPVSSRKNRFRLI